MTSALSNPLADALNHDAPRFNARFERAAAQMPRLEPAEFADFLRRYVGPIAQSVAAVAPDRVFQAVEALYRVALQTVGRELPQRYPTILDLWQVFNRLPNLIAQDASAVTALTINVTCNLADTPGARVGDLLAGLKNIGPGIQNIAVLRDSLTVLAWRAGYAHARSSALDAILQMPPEIAQAILGVPLPNPSPAERGFRIKEPHSNASSDAYSLSFGEGWGGESASIVARLRTDPWLRPDDLIGTQPVRTPRIAYRPGGFRGFGGPFLRPPTVARYDGQFVLTDGETWCTLATDTFGATLRRLDTVPKTAPQPVSQRWLVMADGQISNGAERFQSEALANATSWASDDTTLVITTALSYKAYVIGWLPVKRTP